jgi:hypothetical protein
MIPGLITRGRYADAVDAALRFCHAVQVFVPTQNPNLDTLDAGVDVAESLAGLSSNQRESIEGGAVALAVVPAACWVGLQISSDVRRKF